ncbi:MscL family protein [Candidatus Dojkabacteria bacterium]|nr:MscL family protein [Candidatus Dojkabacteria bacterium]
MTRIKTELKIEESSSQQIAKKLKEPVNGFLDFLNKYSIISFSIGVIVGQATKDTVNILVSGIISPAIQLVMPNIDLTEFTVNINKSEFQIGLFMNSLIQMLIVMAIVYIVVGIIFKRRDLLKIPTKKLPKKSSKTKPIETQE